MDGVAHADADADAVVEGGGDFDEGRAAVGVAVGVFFFPGVEAVGDAVEDVVYVFAGEVVAYSALGGLVDLVGLVSSHALGALFSSVGLSGLVSLIHLVELVASIPLDVLVGLSCWGGEGCGCLMEEEEEESGSFIGAGHRDLVERLDDVAVEDLLSRSWLRDQRGDGWRWTGMRYHGWDDHRDGWIGKVFGQEAAPFF